MHFFVALIKISPSYHFNIMPKRTYIITGGNSGLGYQTAKYIAMENPENQVVIASRNNEKSQIAVKELTAATHNPNISMLMLDLATLVSVRRFYAEFSEHFGAVHGLVCNAISSGGTTFDGFEMTFGTGHLGHFLLANLLLKNMADNGRIIFVSSDQHNPPRFIASLKYNDAIDFAYPHKGNHSVKYSFTKLCNIYCAYLMAEKIQMQHNKNICVNAFNPGFMADTGLAKPKNAVQRLAQRITPLLARLMGTLSSAELSGKILADYMLNPRYLNVTGKYLDRAHEVQSSALSYNRANATNLWHRSIEMVKLQRHESVLY
jgi:NAD(P)-dependent dehydrogenase (short-subunit alcohol dehydrogenase family)